MQQSAAAWLFEIALCMRVFADVVRGCRRLLTAGVRIGITGLTGTRAPSRSAESTRDVPVNGDGGPEETGGAVGYTPAVPIDQWDPTVQMAYWGFHHQRRQDYMRYAYLQLGSDADAEEAVDLTFDQVMDRWPRMLRMENLEGRR